MGEVRNVSVLGALDDVVVFDPDELGPLGFVLDPHAASCAAIIMGRSCFMGDDATLRP